jgi:myo-inositol 2-dehydrogenase / D-chiro-inositol 1-dehydrogenase
MRIAMVGCGKIAERHLHGYRQIDGVEVTVTDIVERGAEVARAHNAGWDPRPHDLIADPTVDAVDICTPTPTHADFIIEALEAGKHVFCEKPVARDMREAQAIRDAAAASDGVLMVGYLYRFHPAFQFVRELLDADVLGDVYLASFRLGGRGSHKAWKHRVETGGGAGNEMLVHMLDLALWYFGEPWAVHNLWTDTLRPNREIEGDDVRADAEDVILLRLGMADDVSVICQSDLVTPGYMNHVEIQGTNGSLFTSILGHMPTTLFLREAVPGYDAGQHTLRFPPVDLFERELRHFVDACRAGGHRLNSIEDSMRLMAVVECALGVGADVQEATPSPPVG